MAKIPVVDLFAGAGGLSVGAEQAGGDVRVMVELDEVCCRTLRENHRKGCVIEESVRGISGRRLREAAGVDAGEPLVVIGGAPCQPFSKAAYWTDPGDDSRYRQARARGEEAPRPQPILVARPDARRSLVQEFLRLVRGTRADGFVFENVPSILHPRNRAQLMKLQADAERAGYCTTLLQVNAADYGVPQRRVRVFLLGAKGQAPLAPEPTHALESNSHGRLPAITAGEVLAPFAGDEYSEPEEKVTGRWAEHLRAIPPGWNYKALTAWAGHPSPVFVAETRFWSFLLKLSPTLPSWTIAANPGPWVGPFHWDSRRLRTQELAALQGFPGNYKFAGTRRERVRQIGNAVPPPLAQQMTGSVLTTVRSQWLAQRSGRIALAS